VDRVFLDANVLFSAAYRTDAGLLRLWRVRDIQLCASHYALEEARINLDESAQQTRLTQLAAKLQLFDPADQRLPSGIVLAAKDVPILLAAIAAHATHLLTGDFRHFGQYFRKRIGGVLILTPADYLHGRQKTSRR
jgi:uncharacterized protein